MNAMMMTVEALFKPDHAEIDRISAQINVIQMNHPSKLALVKITASTKSNLKN